MKKLTEIFEGLPYEKHIVIEKLVKELSKLEHESDLTKNDIRSHLPKTLFLPIGSAQFLEILSIQDKVADQAENIGHLLSLASFKEMLYENLYALYKKNSEAFWKTSTIIKMLSALLESSFGGMEAEKVKIFAEKISYIEYEADKMKHQIMKDFFSSGEHTEATLVYLYTRLIEEINKISHISEKLANRIRMMLELK